MPQDKNKAIEHTIERVIIFVDIVGSTTLKVEKGDAIGSTEIMKKLNSVEAVLLEADSTARRHGPSEGDSFLLIGTDAFSLFHAAINFQVIDKAWKPALTVRIAIGHGEFNEMPDGQFKSLRGASIDLTRRILEFCEPGSVVVTGSVREIIRAAGYGNKLNRCSEILKGFGEETFYTIVDKLDHLKNSQGSRRVTDNKNIKELFIDDDQSTPLTIGLFTQWIKQQFIPHQVIEENRYLMQNKKISEINIAVMGNGNPEDSIKNKVNEMWEISKRMNTILSFGKLVWTAVFGIVTLGASFVLILQYWK